MRRNDCFMILLFFLLQLSLTIIIIFLFKKMPLKKHVFFKKNKKNTRIKRWSFSIKKNTFFPFN